MKINITKSVILVIALLINSGTCAVRVMVKTKGSAPAPAVTVDPQVVEESNSAFKELKKLFTCFKDKAGCSRKQIAAMFGAAAGIVLLITGGTYLGFRLFKKGGSNATGEKLVNLVARNTQITDSMLNTMSSARINAKNKEGQTALMLVLQKGDIALATQFINAGADIHATDNEGKTVADYVPDQDAKTAIYFMLKKVYPKSWKDVPQNDKEQEVISYIAAAAQELSWPDLQQLIRENTSENEANALIRSVESQLSQL